MYCDTYNCVIWHYTNIHDSLMYIGEIGAKKEREIHGHGSCDKKMVDAFCRHGEARCQMSAFPVRNLVNQTRNKKTNSLFDGNRLRAPSRSNGESFQTFIEGGLGQDSPDNHRLRDHCLSNSQYTTTRRPAPFPMRRYPDRSLGLDFRLRHVDKSGLQHCGEGVIFEPRYS